MKFPSYGLNISAFFKLLNKNFINQFDIIHIHGFHTLFSLQSSICCIINKKEFIFSPHYHGIGHSNITKIFFKIYSKMAYPMLTKASRIICVSDFEKSLLLSNFHLDVNNIEVIPNGVSEFSKIRFSNKNRQSILYVGFLREYKGVQFILMALKILLANGKDIDFIIIGEGEYKNNLITLAKDLDISSHTYFINKIDDEELHNFIQISSAILLLSKAEAYGIIVAEGLSHGVPCIVTNTSALKEFSSEIGCYSINYPPNIEELANTLTNVLENEIEVGPFSNKIMLWENIAIKYLEIYNDINNKS